MTYINLQSCKHECLTSCFPYYGYYRCQFGLTYYEVILYCVYFILIVSAVIVGFVVYGRYKIKHGFIKEKNGLCCFKYVRNQQQHEMRQVIYIGDEDGAITQVGQNFVLVPTNEARNQQNVSIIQPPSSTEQLKAPNTAPYF